MLPLTGHRQVVDLVWWLRGLVVVAIAARYKGYRYPIEVIGHAVWLYHRFALSLRDGSSTMLIEALAGYDEIEPMNSLESIQEQIAEALRDEDNADNQALARSIVSNMFEDQRILGPFAEAVDTLPDDQRRTLYAMSVLAPGVSVSCDYAMRHLAENVYSADGIIARALALGAGSVPARTGLVQEQVAAHLHGLQGWVKISPALPPAVAADADPTDPSSVVWRLVDELLLSLLRGDADPVRAEQIWQQLIAELRTTATVVLADIDNSLRVASISSRLEFNPDQLLLAAYPNHIRLLLEWSLAHRGDFAPVHQHGPWSVGSYITQTLAEVGTAETADLLRHHYIHDSQLGADAVATVRSIDGRLQN